MAPRRKFKPKSPSSNVESGQIDGQDGNEEDGQTDAPSEDKDCKCTLCDSTFKTRRRLALHMNIHTKRFPCQHCGQCCSSPWDLQRHERTHTGNRSHRCPNCDFSTAKKSDVMKHFKICIFTEPRTAENYPFMCDTCSKRFKVEKYLHQHQNIHTDKFKCDVCGKRNSSSTELRIHRRIHTGEKPYSCQKCVYRASDPSQLKIHEKTCNGKKRNPRLMVIQDQPVNHQQNVDPAHHEEPLQPISHKVKAEDHMDDYKPSERINLTKETGRTELGGQKKKKIGRKRLLSLDEDSDDPETLMDD